MIKSKDCTGKKGSIFECDRCKCEIHTPKDDRYRVAVQNVPRSVKTVKAWDLCRRCYVLLYRAIEKGPIKKVNEEEK